MNQRCEILKTCVQRSDEGVCKISTMCLAVIDKCKGCARVENNYCKVCASPETKWRVNKTCPMATHIEAEIKEVKKVNPLKQSKQAMRNKKK